MEFLHDIPVVYENGVFRPETPVSLPERSRHRLSVTPEAAATPAHAARRSLAEVFNELRSLGVIRNGGRVPTRDELHERD